MTAVMHHPEDILAQIDTKAAPAELALSTEQVASPSGCITLLSVISVCYQVSDNAIDITASLKTPLGDISLGKIHIDPQHPTATIGGGINGFKAEVTATFDFSTRVLELCGKACAPFVGCTSGCTSIHL